MFLAYSNEVESGKWQVLPQTQNTKTLLNNTGTYFLQSNVCPHQGSLIRSGTGLGFTTRCPYHGWRWDADGLPQGSGSVGHSAGSSECKNVHALAKTPVFNWNGFLFDQPIPFDFDISGNYVLEQYRQDRIRSNYVPIMDLFLDVDHIPIVHPKVYDRIDIPNVKDVVWHTWTGGSAQVVTGGKALWLATYDGTMFEYQPGAVFIMVNQSVTDTITISHVYKYRDLNYSQTEWTNNDQVWEQAWQQDREQAERLEPGWRTAPLEHLDQEKQNYRGWMWNQNS